MYADRKGRKCGIEEEQLPEVVRFLHNVGAVIHFDDAFGDLSDIVIINPQWLASVQRIVQALLSLLPDQSNGR